MVIGGIYNLFETDHYSREYRFQHKDGTYRWMNDNLQLERDNTGEPVRIVGYWIDVSAHKQAKLALGDSEIRYRQMAELSPDGMFVHVDGNIVFANAKLAQILKISSPAELIDTQAIELIAPEYRKHIKRRRGHVMQGQITTLEQSEFLRSDGSRVPVERTGALITWEGEPAILVLIRDVSERETAAQALRDSRDQLRLITDNLPVLIVYIDAQRTYRFVNKICAEWHARPSEEIIGKKFLSWLVRNTQNLILESRKYSPASNRHSSIPSPIPTVQRGPFGQPLFRTVARAEVSKATLPRSKTYPSCSKPRERFAMR